MTSKNEEGELIAGGGVWYAIGDARNMEFRLPGHLQHTAFNAETAAALLTIQRTHPGTPLNIYCAKESVRKTVIKKLSDMEDRAKTWFRTAEDAETSSDKAGYAGAAQLAQEGCRRPMPDQVSTVVPPEMVLKGLKLSKLTQALAYAAIKETKEIPFRRATDNRVKQVQLATKQNFNRLPAPPEIWKSIRHKDFTRQTRNFLWKSMHDAHHIGKFWKHIPECGDREICQFCGETEDLEHIVLKCNRPGQQQVWELAKELWLKKHSMWPNLSIGAILGCGLASITNEKGHHLPGASRFYRILISESLFIIWKIRNDCVIGNGGVPLPVNEIRNKWLFTMNQRLDLDRVLSNRLKYGAVSIRPLLVLQTWASTLKNEVELPQNWLIGPRVLVGIEPNQPSATPPRRRGRNR
ncbi:hypothetical protein C8F04DRAFT_1324243 [Mycena alexandri]|uniref:Reverse transcriptase zinc-binding domain-containing protein n=1 Tax=Mycena alexandri TaxID=1745969 RepID=A0AAD6S559_9AGAR|nr:hypothetical protein C8F04DRAFT_1324243 [Mycena alexandri]